MDQGHLWVVPMRKGDNSCDRQHPSRRESLNNQLASHTGVSLENQSGPSCHISKPVCKLHRCQLELAATLLQSSATTSLLYHSITKRKASKAFFRQLTSDIAFPQLPACVT